MPRGSCYRFCGAQRTHGVAIMAFVVAVAQRKGGAGKSTLAANLAYLAQAMRSAEKILLKHPIPFNQ
jgi:Mrp family chromosome partitioning ATPase